MHLPAKEIYVFTDLSRASWRADETARLQDSLHKVAGVSLYLIDVGVTEPSDFALGDLHLSQQSVAAGGSVDIQTDVSSVGIEGQRAIELELIGPDGKLQKISEQIKQLKPGDSQTVDFRLASLKPDTQQGRVKIVGQDSLSADDVRYFSIEVRPPWPLLIVAQRPTAETANYLTGAAPWKNGCATRPVSFARWSTTANCPGRRSTDLRPSACSIHRAWNRAPGSD